MQRLSTRKISSKIPLQSIYKSRKAPEPAKAQSGKHHTCTVPPQSTLSHSHHSPASPEACRHRQRAVRSHGSAAAARPSPPPVPRRRPSAPVLLRFLRPLRVALRQGLLLRRRPRGRHRYAPELASSASHSLFIRIHGSVLPNRPFTSLIRSVHAVSSHKDFSFGVPLA